MKKVMTGSMKMMNGVAGYVVMVPADKVSECRLVSTNGELCTWEVPDITMVETQAYASDDDRYGFISWFEFDEGEPDGHGFTEQMNLSDPTVGIADTTRFKEKIDAVMYMLDSMASYSGGLWVELTPEAIGEKA